MKLIILASFFIVMTACSCMPPADPADAPISLNQKNLVLEIDGETYSEGMVGTTNSNQDMYVHTYGEGSFSIDGEGDACTYHDEIPVGGVTKLPISLGRLPQRTCVYALQLNTNSLDAPAIGRLVVRYEIDPYTQPARTRVSTRIKNGVNWLQTTYERIDTEWAKKYDPRYAQEQAPVPNKGVDLFPTGTYGEIIVNGCGIPQQNIPFVFNEGEAHIITIGLAELYVSFGSIDRDCIFDILIDNHDWYIKEGASYYVSVTTGLTSSLVRPLVYKKSNKMCFSFTDPYVAGISVNGKLSGYPSYGKKCVQLTARYYVEAVTRKSRIFYGVFDGYRWIR